LLGSTWRTFSSNFGPCALVGLVIIAILFGVWILSTGMNFAAQASREAVIIVGFQLVNQFISFFIQTWITLGIAAFGLKLCRTGRAEVSDFFGVGSFFLRGLGMQLLIGLLVAGVVLLCLLPIVVVLVAQGGPSGVEDNPVPMILTAIVCVMAAMVLAIWIQLRLCLAIPFLLDRNMGVFDSMQNSNTYMSGNKLTMFGVWIVVGFASAVVVICTCLIGTIFVYPFGGILTALAYLTATGQLRTPAKGF